MFLSVCLWNSCCQGQSSLLGLLSAFLSWSPPAWSLQTATHHRSLLSFPCSNIKMPSEHTKQGGKLTLLSCLFLQVSGLALGVMRRSEQGAGLGR